MLNEIISCRDWLLEETKDKCKNANSALPLAMKMPKECRIMIVSQAPSKAASSKQILADVNNTTFNEFLAVFGVDKNTFDKYFYWTHYGKCYPGKREGGDQWPKVHCANKFIKREIDACKEKGLVLVIGVAEPSSKYLYSEFVNLESKISTVKFQAIRNRKYSSYNINWLFVKHTATTAAWSIDGDDKSFIENILREEINKALYK